MTIPVKLKRSGTTTATPSSLEYGEIAINYADGVVFYRDSSDVIQSFTLQAYALSSHTHAASDITSGTLDAARIANDSITYAKIQNVSTTDRLLGRSSAGAGDVEEIVCTSFGRSLIDDADAAAARTTLSVQPTASPAFTGTVTLPSTVNMGSTTGNVIFDLGHGATADRFALVDCIGDSTYTDFGLRVGRNNGGANGASLIQHRGTGELQLTAFEAGSIVLRTSNTIALTVSASQVSTFSGQLLVTAGSASAPGVAFSGDTNTGIYSPGADQLAFSTNQTERLLIDASGNVLVGTTNTNPAGNNVVGTTVAASGYLSITRDADNPVLINRKTNDGTLTTYQQDGTTEGSVSVSGNTVSYNAFCGSHWAQLIDGSRPAILRGTVLETIDEMCEWPDGKSDRLVRVKVSDTPASRRVYGVFMAWDEEYASTGDLYATALGAYMVRVSGIVQSGDLLESAGDGTARTQPDDIVRSSTIGKVSSTHRVAEYDDGSYLVPCVLMCG